MLRQFLSVMRAMMDYINAQQGTNYTTPQHSYPARVEYKSPLAQEAKRSIDRVNEAMQKNRSQAEVRAAVQEMETKIDEARKSAHS